MTAEEGGLKSSKTHSVVESLPRRAVGSAVSPYARSPVVAGLYISVQETLGRRRRESQLPAKGCSFVTDNIHILLG
jgi:hypothetical protein